jgi:hypothetical protein
MSTKWRIYCTEPGDEGWQTAWSDTVITTCPNNVSHSVNPNSTSEIGWEKEAFRLTPTITTSKSSKLLRIERIHYSTLQHGNLRRVKFIGNKEGNVSSYDVEVYDVTNQTSLVSGNFTNTGIDDINDVGTISSSPSGDVILEINAKQTGGTGNSGFYIDQIIVYGEK